MVVSFFLQKLLAGGSRIFIEPAGAPSGWPVKDGVQAIRQPFFKHLYPFINVCRQKGAC
jgi:hypothetical protein